jgi:hypothetical protein
LRYCMSINLHKTSYTVFVILVTFESKLNFADRFKKSSNINKFIKIHLVGAELFHAKRLMDLRMDKQTWQSYY